MNNKRNVFIIAAVILALVVIVSLIFIFNGQNKPSKPVDDTTVIVVSPDVTTAFEETVTDDSVSNTVDTYTPDITSDIEETTADVTESTSAPDTSAPYTDNTEPTDVTEPIETVTSGVVVTTDAVESTVEVTAPVTEPPHVHAFGEWVIIKQATCTENGKQTRTCSCGESESSVISKAGHKYDSGKVTTAATCTATGIKTYTCSVCGNTKTETLEKLKHDYTKQVTKEASCTEQGECVYTCKNCGHSYTETVAKTAHIWDNGVVTLAPTYESEGIKTYTCIECGATKTSKIDVLYCSHDYQFITIVYPTYEECGYELYRCTKCGHETHDSKASYPQLNKEVERREWGLLLGRCSVCWMDFTPSEEEIKSIKISPIDENGFSIRVTFTDPEFRAKFTKHTNGTYYPLPETIIIDAQKAVKEFPGEFPDDSWKKLMPYISLWKNGTWRYGYDQLG